MDEKSQSRLAPPLIAAAVLLPTLMLISYATGYFWLSEYDVVGNGGCYCGPRYPRRPQSTEVYIYREYPSHWLATLYAPAGLIEERMRGIDVEITTN